MLESSYPPSYNGLSDADQGDSPPDCSHEFSADFTIGSRKTYGPLVNLDDIKVHLALLHNLHDLRATVELGKDDRLLGWIKDVTGERRWSWFVGVAVERFERWVQKIRYVSHTSFFTFDVPPLDVCMVWHSYLLNPSRFAEDCARLPELYQLRYLNDVFFIMLRKVYKGEISFWEPSPEQSASFSQKTDTPFNPLDATEKLLTKSVECPKCQSQVSAFYLNTARTGYVENFKIRCGPCNFEITKDKLGVSRFVKDLCRASTNHGVTVPAGLLAGTLYSPELGCDTKRAQQLKSIVLSARRFTLPVPTDLAAQGGSHQGWLHLQEAVDYSMQSVREVLRSVMKSEQMIDRIVSAYADDRLFSVDLVGVVLRQGSFIKKIYDAGWTNPVYFADGQHEPILQQCIARYHSFLDLMAESPASFFVPTLDIDLAWHTHQLMSSRYAYDCRRYVGRCIDHSDEVTETHLSSAFDDTCRAWKTRFNAPYSDDDAVREPREEITVTNVQKSEKRKDRRKDARKDAYKSALTAPVSRKYNSGRSTGVIVYGAGGSTGGHTCNHSTSTSSGCGGSGCGGGGSSGGGAGCGGGGGCGGC